jgi:hypothetical protein
MANWIAKATKNKGGLHKSLGVKVGKKLTTKELSRGKKMGGKVAKQVALAKTLKKLKK